MSVSVLLCSKQLIHIAVTHVVAEAFMCTFVYGYFSRNERGELFKILYEIASATVKPWLTSLALMNALVIGL